MTDRFKFRFWNKLRKAYENTYDLKCCEHLDYVVPEQCTGLRDKNGKLIYENDVLKLIDQGIEYEVSVYWESGMYCFAITPNSANLVFSDLSDNETTCEIIGNIHENEDLLENEE